MVRGVDVKIYDFNGSANLAGKRIKQARTALGLSQDELAARLQVENVILSQKCISRMEKGERFITDYELFMLAKVLKKDMYWLIGEENTSK